MVYIRSSRIHSEALYEKQTNKQQKQINSKKIPYCLLVPDMVVTSKSKEEDETGANLG